MSEIINKKYLDEFYLINDKNSYIIRMFVCLHIFVTRKNHQRQFKNVGLSSHIICILFIPLSTIHSEKTLLFQGINA